jgi:hypothetical protein
MLEGLDSDLPPQVALEVVGEAGTNKPLKENNRSRRVRHISSGHTHSWKKRKNSSKEKNICSTQSNPIKQC